MYMFKKQPKGFTLIELLVVVAIISLLSSVVLASIRDARQKAQAKAFRQEIAQFVNALELYRIDHNNYPADFDFTINSSGVVTNGSASHATLSNNISPYIKKYQYPIQEQCVIGEYHLVIHKENANLVQT